MVVTSTSGKVRVLITTATGNQVSLWVDGKPTSIAGRAADFELAKGRHTLTLAVATTAQVNVLTLELQDIAGSPAQVQIVGGK